MRRIISSLDNLPKTLEPDSDVEAFRQEVVKLQDSADKLLDD